MKAILRSLDPGILTRDPNVRMLAVAGAAAGAAAVAMTLGVPAWAAFFLGIITAVVFHLSLRMRDPIRLSREHPEVVPEEGAVLAMMDALPTPLIAIGENERVVHANRAARVSLPRLTAGTHHAHLIRAPEFVAAVSASLVDGVERKVSFAANPGRERMFEARIFPTPSGDPFGSESRLIVQVEDRTEAHRAERLRSDFIANASHELRTPLASIIGYIETLQHHARDDPEARIRFLGIMERQAMRMQRLVDDLMSLSRIELTEHMRPGERCSLSDIAAEAAAALVPVAQAEHVTLEIDVPRESLVVPGDRDQLYQVFLNLIDNAIKYAGSGARVRVSGAAPSRAFPNRAGVTVTDTGPGIPREHLPRLTERFYRVNTGQSRNKGGTGLGLAIVKHILNRHEGKLEITSVVGKGSSFTVWLPRKEASADAVPRSESAAAPFDTRD